MRNLLWVLVAMSVSGCALFQKPPTTFTNMREKVDPSGAAIALSPQWCDARNIGNNTNTRHLLELVGRGTDQLANQHTVRQPLPCDAFHEDMFSSYDTRTTGWYGLVTFDDEPEQWMMRLAYREKFQTAMSQSKANYVLATFVRPGARCGEKSVEIRDSKGRDMGSIGTGEISCHYSGRTGVAQLLVNPKGTAVWRSFHWVDTVGESYDQDVETIMSQVPVNQFVADSVATAGR